MKQISKLYSQGRQQGLTGVVLSPFVLVKSVEACLRKYNS